MRKSNGYKLIFGLCLILLASNFSFTKSTKISKNFENIYSRALREFLKSIEKNQLERMRKEYNPLFIFQVYGITDSISQKMEGFNLKVLALENFNKTKSNFPLIRLSPAQINKHGEITISATFFGVTWQKNKWQWVNSGGHSCNFKFNCATDQYDLVKSQNVSF